MGTPLGRGRRPISSIAWEGTREERGSTLVDDRIAPAPAPGARIIGFDAVRNLRVHDSLGRAELGRYLGLADNRLRQHARGAVRHRRISRPRRELPRPSSAYGRANAATVG